MKKINFVLILVATGCIMLASCVKTVTTPNMPSTYDGRPVDDQGTVYVSDRNVTFRAWDSGTIDGDIITLIVNGEVVLSSYTLDGPNNKKEVKVKLDNNGYNYVLLFAHNEGSISPNTAALSLDDGKTVQDLVLSADLLTNGAMSIYVQ